MKSPKALVIVTEGVGAGMLGAYGSATSTTPALNRLAARSLVLDQCLIDTHELPRQLQSLWTACHASQTNRTDWNIWKHWSTHGLSCQLLTDSSEVAELAQQAGCDKVTLIDVQEEHEAADYGEDCGLVQVFAEAMDLLASEDAPDVLWIHSRALRLAWDAPVELRAAMTDPEDPPPPVDVRLPEMQLDEDSDPDLVVGWGQVAAAQLAVLDEAIDGLQQAIADREDADEWSWMFCSLGGIPLGEHGSLGLPQQVGYSEEVAAAAMVRPANSIPIGSRRGELCQLPDITATLLAAMNLLPADSLTWARSLLQAAPPSCTSDWSPQLSWAWGEHAGRLWLRTPAWSLIQRDTDTIELYVKPDDRWEVNDVADRSSDVVEQLTALLPQVRAATQAGRRDDLPPVPEILANLFR